jgi:2-phosphoglycerate kinase
MRQFHTPEEHAALHRSSFDGCGDPVQDYMQCCQALDVGVESIVRDAQKRGQSLVLEGVHLSPSRKLLDMWTEMGGEAMGVLLVIADKEQHRKLIFKRGELLKRPAEKQMLKFQRIRAIQQELIQNAHACDWRVVEQELTSPVL